MLLYRISLAAREADDGIKFLGSSRSELDVTTMEAARYKFFQTLDECIDEAKVVLSAIVSHRLDYVTKSLCHISEIRKYTEAYHHLGQWINSDEIVYCMNRLDTGKFHVFCESRLMKDHEEYHLYGIDYKVERSLEHEEMKNAMIEDGRRNQANSLAGRSSETELDPNPNLDRAVIESKSKHYNVRAKALMEVRYVVYERRRKEIVIEGKTLRGDEEDIEVFSSDWVAKREWRNIIAEYTSKKIFDNSISLRVIECDVEIPGISEPIYIQLAGRANRDTSKSKHVRQEIIDFGDRPNNPYIQGPFSENLHIELVDSDVCTGPDGSDNEL